MGSQSERPQKVVQQAGHGGFNAPGILDFPDWEKAS